MLNSQISLVNGSPCLCIDGTPTAAMAYTTYFEERSRREDFVKAGYRIFFVNVSFTLAPINSNTGFSPFRVGVFENAHSPDYSEFENATREILRVCPDAVIFPRIYISMPRWWVDTHPRDVAPTQKGGLRELLFSEAFRKDGGEMLRQLVRHIKSADYAARIGGWHISGGMTQEWFFHEKDGGLCDGALAPYRDWVKKSFATECASLPDREDFQYNGQTCNTDENAGRYARFCNLGVAETIDHFARIIKDETDHTQVVGTFYGYSFESNRTVLFGSHALRALIDSPSLDFFSSPNAYTDNRAFGIDWADMIPVDSVKKHGKLCFIECDIRTHLTTGVQEARPNEYPDELYRLKNGTSVWAGPPTRELSVMALRKSFAHQITKASGIWWFDMWGGWYDDPTLMRELCEMRRLYETPTEPRTDALAPEVILFADERGYANLFSNSPQLKGIGHTRTAMGNTGVPFDTYMAEDAENVLKHYRAAVFAMPVPSEAGKRAMELCERMGIPYLSADEEHCALTVDEICEFYQKHGVHFYTKERDVVYVGNGYVALHSATGGVKRLRLPRTCTASAVFGADLPSTLTDTLEFSLEENATALFSIT